MTVPFGFVAETLVQTPDGPRPIADLAPGHLVLAWTDDGLTPRPVVAVHADAADHLVAIRLDPDDGNGTHEVRGVSPGTYLWDAFEEMFRGAASLSSLAELVWCPSDGDPIPRRVDETVEHHRPGTPLHHLTLEGPEAAFVADGVVVRHRPEGP